MSEQSSPPYDLDGDNDISAIKDELGQKRKHSELKINRVPDQAISDLKDLAYDQFAGDYGMALTFLLKTYELRDDFQQQIKQNLEKMRMLENEINRLQNKVQELEGEDESKVDTIGE